MRAEVLATQDDLSLLRPIDAVDHVEHRTLAGTIRADDRADLVFANVEGNVGQRLDATEGEGDTFSDRE
jgi:hypothetical protein